MRVDLNCLLGHWPFRKLHRSSFQDLKRSHAQAGISLGWAASLNSVFYNDPYEGELELKEMIRGTNYRHVLTVNPTLPYFLQDLERGRRDLGICAVRLYPTYHGYSLRDEKVHTLLRELDRLALPLLLTMRLEDERLNYPLAIEPLPLPEIAALARAHPRLPIVLLSPTFGEVIELTESFPGGNLFFDTSNLGHNLFPVEKLVAKVGSSRLVYGSGFPLKALRSSILQLEQAEIPPAAAAQIFCNQAVLKGVGK